MKLLLCLAAVLALSHAADPDKNLAELATSLNLTSLVKYLTDASLVATFSGTDKYTIFAPTDEAFEGLTDAQKTSLADIPTLTKILKYHVVSGQVMSSDLENDKLVDSLDTPNKLRTNKYTMGDDTVYFITGKKVIDPNHKATNGILHIVENVVFAPTENVVEFANRAGYEKLKAAVNTAKLETTLSGEGPFTLFAPNDAAFAKIADAILQNETEIKKILLNHAVSGTLYSAALSDGQELKNVGEKAINVKIENGMVKLNGEATVIEANIPVKNGVIHVIDNVLTKMVDPSPTGGASRSVASLTALFAALLSFTYLRY